LIFYQSGLETDGDVYQTFLEDFSGNLHVYVVKAKPVSVFVVLKILLIDG
jgi:hypothetical protein